MSERLPLLPMLSRRALSYMNFSKSVWAIENFSRVQGRGQVLHSYTISALAVSILSKLR